jgi:hypothetical protein
MNGGAEWATTWVGSPACAITSGPIGTGFGGKVGRSVFPLEADIVAGAGDGVWLEGTGGGGFPA